MQWSLDFLPQAEKDLARLDRKTRERVIRKIEWLAGSFDAIIPVALTGEFRYFYKLRVGDWRVFYQSNWERRSITICYIDRRDKAYK